MQSCGDTILPAAWDVFLCHVLQSCCDFCCGLCVKGGSLEFNWKGLKKKESLLVEILELLYSPLDDMLANGGTLT